MSTFIQFLLVSISFGAVFTVDPSNDFTQDTLQDSHGKIIFSSVVSIMYILCVLLFRKCFPDKYIVREMKKIAE